MALTCTGEVQVVQNEIIFTEKVLENVRKCSKCQKGDIQGAYGVPIPRGAQETTEYITQCFGQVEQVVFSHRLDLMILQFFCNIRDSVYLSCY